MATSSDRGGFCLRSRHCVLASTACLSLPSVLTHPASGAVPSPECALVRILPRKCPPGPLPSRVPRGRHKTDAVLCVYQRGVTSPRGARCCWLSGPQCVTSVCRVRWLVRRHRHAGLVHRADGRHRRPHTRAADRLLREEEPRREVLR